MMTSRNSEAKLEPNRAGIGWQISRESEQKTGQISRKIDGSNTRYLVEVKSKSKLYRLTRNSLLVQLSLLLILST